MINQLRRQLKTRDDEAKALSRQLEEAARSKSLISLDVRDNRRLCGPLPPGLHVNPVPEDWKGFCAKASSEDSACEVLTSRGTGLGSPCK